MGPNHFLNKKINKQCMTKMTGANVKRGCIIAVKDENIILNLYQKMFSNDVFENNIYSKNYINNNYLYEIKNYTIKKTTSVPYNSNLRIILIIIQ